MFKVILENDLTYNIVATKAAHKDLTWYVGVTIGNSKIYNAMDHADRLLVIKELNKHSIEAKESEILCFGTSYDSNEEGYYYITVTHSNEADEAEFIMRMTC